ncbi:CYTL1 domain-containing protein [Astyanax mexicanus]|uniref:CYTL1 domain-containing protein n=1 Tax=Astyanax mexicanus TaxID=7994 RepID=UPI0020CB1A00|nr:CYTL1 domain-containing protein [Astyanax mexicanus]
MLGSTLLGLMVVTLVWGQQYPIPPTCYSKVLTMAVDINARAAQIKNVYDAMGCSTHLPDLYIDVHNACVISTMSSYLSNLRGIREGRCGYSRPVQLLMTSINQLNHIIAQKCHGELAFTYDDCAVLRGRRY